MSLLEKAIVIAVEVHQGKKDKAGQFYIDRYLAAHRRLRRH